MQLQFKSSLLQSAQLLNSDRRRWRTLFATMVLLGSLTACGTTAQRVAVYDFGPGTLLPESSKHQVNLAPVLLVDVEAPAALDGTAVLYRLAYADAQQLRPYAQSRWSMPPSQLLRQRLGESLGQRRNVLSNADAPAPGTLVLRLELEEFSQLFDSSHSSAGLVRVRATLGRNGSPARTLAQTSLVVQQPSASADSAGGVKALALATDELMRQLDQWLQQNTPAEDAPK